MSLRVGPFIVALFASAGLVAGCGPNRSMPDAGGPTGDLGPVSMRPCDPVAYDAGPPPDFGTPPACFGTATGSCSAFTVATCSMGIGCSVTQCHGFPVSCDSLGSMVLCNAQSGCAWSGTTCTGTAAACAMFGDMTACGMHTGCVWSAAMMSCGGLLTPCGSLDATQCPAQPGCSTTNPDAGSPLPDAGSPTCMPCAGTASFDIRVMKAPEPLMPFAHALVHLESTCGGSRDLMTGMDGTLHLDLDRSMGAWTLTAAAMGYAAVSIVGISEIDFDGDIRLDPTPFPMPVSVPASGTVTGGTGTDMVQVDGYDFATTTAGPGGAWSANYFVFPWTVPLRFSAVQIDATGTAVNAAFSPETMRASTAMTGLTLALPSPAATPTSTTVHVHFPAAGELTAMSVSPTGGAPHRVLDVEDDPYLLVGSVTFPPMTSDFVVTSFSALPPNSVFVSWLGATALVNLQLHDVAATDVTFPELAMPVVSGSSLGDTVMAVPASSWDFAQLDIGESRGVPPGWRVIIPLNATSGQSVAIPHLPPGITATTLHLTDMTGAVSFIPLMLKMHRGRAWSAQASSGPVDDWEMSAGGMYGSLMPIGR